MPRDLDILAPTGFMDQDTDIQYLKRGNYRSALNVRHITDNTGSTFSIIPVKGNQLAFTIPEVKAQNKTYRIFFTPTATHSHTVFINDPDNNLLATVTYGGTTITQVRNNFQAAIQQELSGKRTFTLAFDEDFVNVILTSNLGEDYTITSSPPTDSAFQVIIIITEAIDIAAEAEMNPIGSYDVLGELFIWNTSKPTEKKINITAKIFFASENTPNNVKLSTDIPHGLKNGQQIEISGVTELPTLNNTWTVKDVTLNKFRLSNYPPVGAPPFSGSISTGTITLLLPPGSNIGEVGVAIHDESADAWTYTRLLRTKEWNFNIQKQIDSYVEKNNIEFKLYWVDDFNPPRVLTYTGDFITDGAIEIINPNGIYAYETINTETKLIISDTPVECKFLSQSQSGGNLKSGNWRYSVRFLSESLSPTDWIDLINPISVFNTSTVDDPKKIFGGDVNALTSKINKFQVTGLLPGVFKFVELAGINYGETTINDSLIIRRDTLSESQEIILLEHTGNETGTDLVASTLNKRNVNYTTAKNITEIDSRLVLSNLRTAQITDLSEWAQTFEHSIKVKTLNSVGDTGINFGEYQDPDNVHKFVGYMHNETYRFAVKVRFKTGGFSQSFFIDDITINTDNTTPDGRRISGLPNFDLTNSGAIPTEIKVAFIEFSNIDLDFLIDGIKVRELIDEIIFERAEVIPEVLATGIMILAIKNATENDDFEFLPFTQDTIGNFPLVSTAGSINRYQNGRNIQVTPVHNVFIGTFPTMGTFYSPDLFYKNREIFFQSNDKLLNFGGTGTAGLSKTTSGFSGFNNYYRQFGGQFNGFDTLSINDTGILEKGTIITVGGQKYSSDLKLTRISSSGLKQTFFWEMEKGLVIQTKNNISERGTAGIDKGLRYCQYFREQQNKYGKKETTLYIPTGTVFRLNSSSPSIIETGVIEVFGGDVFTQKTYFKYKYGIDGTTADQRWGTGGLTFYSQNRVNTQMRRKDTLTDNDFPQTDAEDWLKLQPSPEFFYNKGYNIRNDINVNVAFDQVRKTPTKFPVRIAFSDLKPQGSFVDSFRQFPPLNFKDLDPASGEIVHMANGNGELLTWQQRKFQRQFFNTRGTLQLNDASEILLGSGAVLNRDGQTLTNYGTSHKWSVIKGKSSKGHDTFYWINAELKKAIRFGFDGAISIADIKGMQSFFANNLRWVSDDDIPLIGKGINGVWDDRNAEVIWGVNGSIKNEKFDEEKQYFRDRKTIVEFEGQLFITTKKTIILFGNILGFLPILIGTKPNTLNGWALISEDDNNFINKYTIVYNEFKDGFTTFFSFLPRIFLKWEDTYLTPRQTSNVGSVYTHDKGDFTSWYDGEVEEDANIEGVINKHTEEEKWMEAIKVNSDIVPKRIEFETSKHKSFLNDTEFETREGFHFSSIKEDSTINGKNDGDTSLLHGKFLKIKFIFEKKISQKLFNFVVKFRISPRLTAK